MLPATGRQHSPAGSEAARHKKPLDRGGSTSRRLCGLSWMLTHNTTSKVDEED